MLLKISIYIKKINYMTSYNYNKTEYHIINLYILLIMGIDHNNFL